MTYKNKPFLCLLCELIREKITSVIVNPWNTLSLCICAFAFVGTRHSFHSKTLIWLPVGLLYTSLVFLFSLYMTSCLAVSHRCTHTDAGMWWHARRQIIKSFFAASNNAIMLMCCACFYCGRHSQKRAQSQTRWQRLNPRFCLCSLRRDAQTNLY